MATNRHDTLDPALLRPGRLDRKIEFPMPDRRQKRLVFSTITAKMNLSEEVDLEDCIQQCGYNNFAACTCTVWTSSNVFNGFVPLIVNISPCLPFHPAQYDCKVAHFTLPSMSAK